MRADVLIRRAERGDLDAIVALVDGAELPVEGVAERRSDFYVAVLGDRAVGVCGLERYGADALLRSVAVSDEERGRGTGRLLVERALADARELGLASVVLLTTTAADYFRRFGFEEVERGDVPEGVRASGELTHICPSTATAMRLAIAR